MITNYQYFLNKLYEGLIMTHPITKYLDNIKDTIISNTPNVKTNIIVDYDKLTFKLEILNNCTYLDIEKINSLCTCLGYFISQYMITVNGKTNIFKFDDNFKNTINKFNNFTKLILYYDGVFDKIIEVPDKIYHATNIKNIHNIKEIGLYPRSGSKLRYHQDRIYFSLNLLDCENIVNKLRNFNKLSEPDYIILEINTKDVKENNFDGSITSVKFRKDPQSDGTYTFSNMPKERIQLLNKIYLPDNIITYDDIIISKNKLIFKFESNIVHEKIVNHYIS